MGVPSKLLLLVCKPCPQCLLHDLSGEEALHPGRFPVLGCSVGLCPPYAFRATQGHRMWCDGAMDDAGARSWSLFQQVDREQSLLTVCVCHGLVCACNCASPGPCLGVCAHPPWPKEDWRTAQLPRAASRFRLRMLCEVKWKSSDSFPMQACMRRSGGSAGRAHAIDPLPRLV